jgi:hypothetical protein
MTILLPLGSGSRWQDNELRYCFRSIEKYLSGWDKIVIVGKLPTWVRDDRVIFIPVEDKITARHKERNIYIKILAGIASGHLGESFLFMNDDHFLLQPFAADKFPYHHKGPMLPKTGSNPYRKSISNTLQLLGQTNDFDTHCPIVYNSESFIKAFNGLTFPYYGYCIKTVYCKRNGIEGSFYPDRKIKDESEFDPNRQYFSTGANFKGLELMEKLYLEKSSFEND